MDELQELVTDGAFAEIARLYLLRESNGSCRSVEESIYSPRDALGDYLAKSKNAVAQPGEYNSDDLVVEIIHEALVYSASKGFNEADSCTLIEVIVKGLSFLINEGGDVLLLTGYLQKQIVLFSQQVVLSVNTYLIQTLIQHCQLYYYLLTDKQEENKQVVSLDLAVGPVDISELKEDCLEDEVLERERLEQLKKSHVESKSEFDEFKRRALLEKEKMLQKVYDEIVNDFNDSSGGVIEDQLKDIVESLVHGHMSTAKDELIFQIKEGEKEIAYNIDAKTLKTS